MKINERRGMGDKLFFFDGQKGDKGLDKDETHALSIKKWAESEGRRPYQMKKKNLTLGIPSLSLPY